MCRCLYKIRKKIRILCFFNTAIIYRVILHYLIRNIYTSMMYDDIWDTQLMFSVVDIAIDSKCHVSNRIDHGSRRRPTRIDDCLSRFRHIYIVTNLASRRGIREFVRGFRDTGRNSSIVPPRTVQLPWPKHGINEIMSLRRATSFESCLIYSLGFLRNAIRYRRY